MKFRALAALKRHYEGVQRLATLRIAELCDPAIQPLCKHQKDELRNLKAMIAPMDRLSEDINALIGLYPQSVSRNVLSDAIGINVTVGHGKNIVSELKTLGALDYPGQGNLRASEMLFLEAVPA